MNAGPGVVRLERRPRCLADLGDGVFEDGVDQVALRREATVEGSHADTRAARDLLDGDVDAFGREGGARRVDDPRAVPLGVAPQRPRCCRCLGHSWPP